ncbi:MAG: hypothetical protein AAGC74_07585 [Verrucomicrobiota bacterium]
MVAQPEKELRFTRSTQARQFAVLGAILIGIAVTLFATAILVFFGYEPPVALWSPLIPLLPAIALFCLSFHCAKHAYLILSPIGVEIFPFFKPSENFRMIPWPEIAFAEIKDNTLILHRDTGKTSGVIISLSPLDPARRQLLKKAIDGRMAEREKNG